MTGIRVGGGCIGVGGGCGASGGVAVTLSGGVGGDGEVSGGVSGARDFGMDLCGMAVVGSRGGMRDGSCAGGRGGVVVMTGCSGIGCVVNASGMGGGGVREREREGEGSLDLGVGVEEEIDVGRGVVCFGRVVSFATARC